MKPQSLQDAIKLQALKKAKRREAGWKDPVVKEHKVTAEDLKESKTRESKVRSPQAPPTTAPLPPSQDLLLITRKLSEISEQLKKQQVDINGLKSNQNAEDLQYSIDTLKAENEKLRSEQLATVKANSGLVMKDELRSEQLRKQETELCSLKKENEELRTMVQKLTKQSVQTPTSPSPSKKSRPPASLEPHTESELLSQQRRDKDLRHFMKTKEGLFDAKYMSIRSVSGGNIVCFKKKIYVPVQLRQKTIGYYKEQHPTDSAALDAMRKNCCWPDLEKDFYAL